MNNIVHTRIDYRLVHGQVVTKWIKQTNANTIVIIDDELSKDEFLAMVYKMAAPTDIEVKIMSVDEASEYFEKDIFYKGKVLLLFKSVEMALASVERGLVIKELQVGGLQNKAGLKVVHNQIALGKEGYDQLKLIEDKGIYVYFQTIPGEEPSTLAKVEKKI